MKADYSFNARCLNLSQKAAPKHTTKSTTDSQLARMVSACMRGNKSLYHRWVAVV